MCWNPEVGGKIQGKRETDGPQILWESERRWKDG